MSLPNNNPPSSTAGSPNSASQGRVWEGMPVPSFEKRNWLATLGMQKLNTVFDIVRAFANFTVRGMAGAQFKLTDGNAVLDLTNVAVGGGGTGPGTLTRYVITAAYGGSAPIGDYWVCAAYPSSNILGSTVNVARPQWFRVSRGHYVELLPDGISTNSVSFTWANTGGWAYQHVTLSASGFDSADHYITPHIGYSSGAVTSVTNSGGNCNIVMNTGINVAAIGDKIWFSGVPPFGETVLTGFTDNAHFQVAGNALGGYVANSGSAFVGEIIFAQQTGGATGVVISGTDVDWIDVNVDARRWTMIPVNPPQ